MLLPQAMPEPTTNRFGARDCQCCGAGLNNHYQHHKRCIANLPVHTNDTLQAWKRGRFDRQRGNHPRSLHASPEVEASYWMGWDFAAPSSSTLRPQ